MKNHEDMLRQRIKNLVDNTLQKVPISKLWLKPLKKYINPFVEEIVDMSQEYVNAKISQHLDKWHIEEE